MATVSVTNPFGALTLSVNIMAASGTETQLAAGAYVVGYFDGNTSKYYNPWNWGYTPATSDAASKWLPSVVSITSYPDPAGGGQIGMYLVKLQPGTSDLVNVASVQTVKVSWNAVWTVASGSF